MVANLLPDAIAQNDALLTSPVDAKEDPAFQALSPDERTTLHQIAIDVPRTACACSALHASPRLCALLVRVMFIWGRRHPASGYVQGSMDLLLPVLAALVLEATGVDVAAPAACEPAHSPFAEKAHAQLEAALDAANLQHIEADAFYIVSALITGLQDYYTAAQPGVQRTVARMEALSVRVLPQTHALLTAAGVTYLQFAWRWAACLLSRELPLSLSMRLFDTYFAELAQASLGNGSASALTHSAPPRGTLAGMGVALATGSPSPTPTSAAVSAQRSFGALSRPGAATAAVVNRVADFHVYVCTALLARLAPTLTDVAGDASCPDFAAILLFLQATGSTSATWTEADITQLVAQAFTWQRQFSEDRAMI
jgi:hypothetical protein